MIIPQEAADQIRDAIAEAGCFLALVGGTLAKIAMDVKLLAGARNAEISRHLSRSQLAELCDPANHLGQSGVMANCVLASFRGR